MTLTQTTEMDLKLIQDKVIKTAIDAGKFIRQESANFDRTRIEQKTAFNNLVSYVDKEAEKRIVADLKSIVPEAGFITEEGTVSQSDSAGLNWIIDPLDGTTNFLHNLPVFAVSIALVRDGEPVVGVIYHIGTDECFYATATGHAYCNERIIQVSNTEMLNESLLATGFPYSQEDKSAVHLEIIKYFLGHTHGIRRLGSAAIDLAYVACGRLEGFFEYNLNPWDVAAGVLIVKRAGGNITDFKGGKNYLFGRELCASNNHVHDRMLEIIQRLWR